MPARERVLVLGGSGWLGAAVVPLFRERFDAWAPSHAELDVAHDEAVAGAIAEFHASAVVNLAAVNPPGDAASMERVNTLGAGTVARAAHAAGARLLHMSTDVVHDGRSAPYRDDAATNPVTPYGRSKAAGEAAVRSADPGALLLRTSLVVDPRVPDRFTRSVLDRLARGDEAALFTDEIRCPIPRGTLAEALAELVLRPDVCGTLNVAGTQALSRADLADRLLPRFGAVRTDLVRRVLAADAAEPRALDLTLDVSRARSLLRTPLRSLDEELAAAG